MLFGYNLSDSIELAEIARKFNEGHQELTAEEASLKLINVVNRFEPIN